jgi:hypothetical protein
MSPKAEAKIYLKIFGDRKAPLQFLADAKSVSKVNPKELRALLEYYKPFGNDMIVSEDLIKEVKAKTGLEIDDFSSAFRFCSEVINQLARSTVTNETVMDDLLKVGIPKENVEVIISVFESNKEELRNKIQNINLAILPSIENIRWRVSFGFEESVHPFVPEARVSTSIRCVDSFGQKLTYSFDVCEDDLDYLIFELSKAKKYLKTLSNKKAELLSIMQKE